MENIGTNVTLAGIFGERWRRVRSITHDDREMHMAHDICEILGIKNVTTAIKGIDGVHGVDLDNRDKVYVPEWNGRRRVHLLSVEGVFQLIMHNRNSRCMEIRNIIACRHLPKVKALKLRLATR